jgi:hypothetical protein
MSRNSAEEIMQKRPPQPAPPLRVFKEKLAAGVSPGRLLLAHDPGKLEPGHHGAVLDHMTGLRGAAFFHALGSLANAAAAGHPHARDLALRALSGREAGPEVAHTRGMIQRGHVLRIEHLPIERQNLMRHRTEHFPKLRGTEILVAPAGFDFAGLLGEGVSTRPPVPSDLRQDDAEPGPAPPEPTPPAL